MTVSLLVLIDSQYRLVTQGNVPQSASKGIGSYGKSGLTQGDCIYEDNLGGTETEWEAWHSTSTEDILVVSKGTEKTKGVVGTTLLEVECLDSFPAVSCFCNTEDSLSTKACLVPSVLGELRAHPQGQYEGSLEPQWNLGQDVRSPRWSYFEETEAFSKWTLGRE